MLHVSIYRYTIRDVDVHVLSHLKQGLAWAADKWLRVISTIMLNKAILNLKQYFIHCSVALSDVF